MVFRSAGGLGDNHILVGGGQEINTGEAGISEWIKALNEKFTHWRIYISDKLTEAEYAEGRVNELLADNDKVTFSPELHLGICLRSFRAENLSAFAHSLLSFNPDASSWYTTIKGRYPIVLARDMAKARTPEVPNDPVCWSARLRLGSNP